MQHSLIIFWSITTQKIIWQQQKRIWHTVTALRKILVVADDAKQAPHLSQWKRAFFELLVEINKQSLNRNLQLNPAILILKLQFLKLAKWYKFLLLKKLRQKLTRFYEWRQKPLFNKENWFVKFKFLFTLQQSCRKPADRKIVHPICRSGKELPSFLIKKPQFWQQKKLFSNAH